MSAESGHAAEAASRNAPAVRDIVVLPLLLSPSFEAPETPQPKSPEAYSKGTLHSAASAARLWEGEERSGTEEASGVWLKRRKL